MDRSKRPLNEAVSNAAELEHMISSNSHQQQRMHINTAGLMLVTVFERKFLQCILLVANL